MPRYTGDEPISIDPANMIWSRGGKDPEERIAELEAALRSLWACLDDNSCDESNDDGTMYQSADLAAARREIERLMPDLATQ